MTADFSLAAEEQASVWPSLKVCQLEEDTKTHTDLSMKPGAKKELGTVTPGC